VVRGDVAEGVAKLKEGEGGPILIAGSRTLAQSLMPHGLIDEYRLMVFPVVLGTGKRLFPDAAEDKLDLKLADTEVFESGVAVLTYRPAG
jgi:dihydrofolate reductase